ncbi:MAG: hypothetical protein A2Y07_04450 [Planctomycetes bacterium GWF2_50_10]|nr:MAG: hypothetical protein A2Y07_04450 [Planctomycetes bacterium GWF2_50_10]
MKRETDITNLLQRDQRKVLRDLRSQVKELNEVLKVVATAQDVNATRKEHMEFLGIVGSRTLTAREMEMAAQGGIPFDELRRITGRKIEACIQNESLRNSLGQGHILRMILAEHEMILYHINDLEAVALLLGKCKAWSDGTRAVEKFKYVMGQLGNMDSHQEREEQIILAALHASGCEDLPETIKREHAKLRKGKNELRSLANCAGVEDFERWMGRLETVLNIYGPCTKQHIFTEERVIYPRALKVIQDPTKWANMKAAADSISLSAFENN